MTDSARAVSMSYRDGSWVPTMDLDKPVFILTCARSGSTLLRFILDAHPELACPAETEFASACEKLAHMWGVLQGINPRGSFALQARTHEANAAIRRAVDEAARSYLKRVGKSRWCDKSLDNILNAQLLAQLWPQARFICLTRHCMDVIASAAESARWGLTGFGFSAYAIRRGNNTVAAVGEYWIDRTSEILGFQQRFPERSHHIRYEDMVTRPEETAEELFRFLGASPAPGITDTCFRVPHDPGQGDEKIWLTSKVHASSVGRGATVPVRAMPRPMRDVVNQILVGLGYQQVTDDWNNTDVTAQSDDTPSSIPEVPAERLEEASRRWPHLRGRVVGVVVRADGGGAQTKCWRVGEADGVEPDPAVGPLIIDGDLATWQAILGGAENLASAYLNGRLAITGYTPTGWPAIPDEAHAIAFLLGLDTVPVTVSEMAAAAAESRRRAAIHR
jgi:hypothetical protein